MSTPWGQIKALFGIKSKESGTAQVRTFNNPQLWQDFIDAVNGTGGYTSNSLNVSAVFACNDRISKDMAMLPFRPVRRIKEGQEIYKEYDQYRLTRYPSSLYTWYTFAYTLNSHVNLWGNGFARIHRRNGRPVGYEIWHPRNVEHVIQDGQLYWKNKETKVIVNDSEMIHLMWYTEDGIIGKSVLGFAKDVITASSNSTKLISEVSKNGMWQPGYLSLKGKYTPSQVEFIEKYWMENYMGYENRARPPVMDEGGEYKSFGQTMEQFQMDKNRESVALEICSFFGVIPSEIGIRTGNVSYNSLEQDRTAYVQKTLTPRCVMWEQEWNRKVVEEQDFDQVWFKTELKGLLRGDLAAQTLHQNTFLQSGVYSINEVRQQNDQNTIPDGDERLIMTNMTTLEAIIKNALNPKQAPQDAPKQSEPDDLKKLLTPTKNGHHAAHSLQ